MKEPLRILMLAANPIDQYRLALTDEYRLLRNKMHDHAEAGSCDLRIEWAARAADLKQALRETKPHIVHFSGHGQDESICLEDDERRTRPLSKVNLELLFNSSRSTLRLVLLNACYSVRQVETLSELVDFVVGTEVPIADHVALQFTNDFYRNLALGNPVREAFNKAQGKAVDNQVSPYGLLVRPGADEVTPLLPPFQEKKFIAELEEINASEMNLASRIFEGVNPPPRERHESNQRNQVLKSKRAVTDKFNFAEDIWKKG